MPEEKKEQSALEQKPQSDEKAEDYKAKYESLQSEHQKSVEQLKSAQGTLDALEQSGAIDWQKVSGEPEKDGEETPAQPDVQRVLQRQEGRILTLQFRVDNPDLREYEDDLVAPFVIKARQKNPRKSQDEVLKIASDDVRSFLTKHKDKVLAEEKAAKAEEDKIKASGLESGGKTTPEDEFDEDKSRRDYIEMRRKQQARRKGVD
jgi:hypothetical protein